MRVGGVSGHDLGNEVGSVAEGEQEERRGELRREGRGEGWLVFGGEAEGGSEGASRGEVLALSKETREGECGVGMPERLPVESREKTRTNETPGKEEEVEGGEVGPMNGTPTDCTECGQRLDEEGRCRRCDSATAGRRWDYEDQMMGMTTSNYGVTSELTLEKLRSSVAELAGDEFEREVFRLSNELSCRIEAWLRLEALSRGWTTDEAAVANGLRLVTDYGTAYQRTRVMLGDEPCSPWIGIEVEGTTVRIVERW